MTRLKVAHLRKQGRDMIIVPLDSSFGHKQYSEQQSLHNQIQVAANSAGLKGTVVVAWQYGASFQFIAPMPWHPYFQSISWSYICANVNREINW